MTRALFLSLFLGLSLFCADAQREEMSPMEILLFKIGFTSLVGEFENEKNITADNSKKIAQLEKNFELLVKFMEMTKSTLMEENDVLAKSEDTRYGIYNLSKIKEELSLVLNSYKDEIKKEHNGEIASLKSEIVLLKRALMDKKPVNKEKVLHAERSAPKRFRVVIDELSVKKRPYAESKTVAVLKRDDIVQFSGCDRYGWCALGENAGYAPKHLFLPME